MQDNNKEAEMWPVLAGMKDFFDDYIPYETYKYGAHSISGAELVSKIKTGLMDMVNEGVYYIRQLKKERELYCIHSIDPGKEEQFKRYYNQEVINTIYEYVEYILNHVVAKHADIDLKLFEGVNLFDFFSEWSSEFSVTKKIEFNSNINAVKETKGEAIDPFTFIDPLMIGRFEEVEKKALEGKSAFKTKVRCAAFCELLYEHKYLIQAKDNIITVKNFAKARYGVNLGSAMDSGKRVARKTHVTKTVNNHKPLKHCF